MKTIMLSLLSVYMLPAALSAQPTISTNEFYSTGDIIQMVNCNPSGAAAGASGTNITWDFSGLIATGSISTTTVVQNTSSSFSTSNLLITLPNGLKQYVLENNTDSYLNGVVDTVSGLVTNYTDCDISKRPITYLTDYIDSYQVAITTPLTYGTGYITTTGDAYGTLILPTGTYNNVLRIRKIQSENDSTSSTSGVNTTTISYLWFDDIHNPPLLRIDSVIGASNTLMYLTSTTGIKDLNSIQSNYQCYLHNSELLLTGDFIYGKIYTVQVYNIIGEKIYSNEFTSNGSSQRLDMNRQLNPGIYIVSIIQKDDPSSNGIVKVLNQ